MMKLLKESVDKEAYMYFRRIVGFYMYDYLKEKKPSDRCNTDDKIIKEIEVGNKYVSSNHFNIFSYYYTTMTTNTTNTNLSCASETQTAEENICQNSNCD